MLREIKTNKNRERELTRRWFNDESMDLIVWLDAAGHCDKFQLCYDKNRNEHALTWIRSRGFVHNAIDDGESEPGGHKRTPILAADGRIDIQSLITTFQSHAQAVDREIIEFVSGKLSALKG